jgi:predicted PurR-regulated permease PerM
MQDVARQFFMLGVVLVIGALLYLLAPILTPFFCGALLAYLTDPLVNKLVRLRVPRVLSVILIFSMLVFVIVLLVLLLIPLIEKQIIMLYGVILNTVGWLDRSVVPWLVAHFGVDADLLSEDSIKSMLADNWTKAGGVAQHVWQTVLHSGFTVLEWALNLLLIPVVTFYLLLDWNKVIQGCRSLLPRQSETIIVKLVRECDDVLSSFFRGQLIVMFFLSVIYSAGLWLIGLQVSLIIGLVSGVTSIVPYLGFVIGIVSASIAAFIQFGTFFSVILVWIIFAVGHLIEHLFLTPYFVGNRIGLHPVAVIFAILAGGKLAGFFGILLALPIAAVLMVWVRYLLKRYRHSPLYQ